MAFVRIYIVRHGETDANREGTIQGQLDTQLNEEGIRQAQLVADALKDVPFNIAFTSDLSRAKKHSNFKTAENILAHHPGIGLRDDQALRERYMGLVQGLKTNAIGRKLTMAGDTTLETKQQFRERALKWWKTAMVPLMSAPGPSTEDRFLTVLVTSHGGFITTLIRALLDNGLAQSEHNGGLGVCWNTSVTIVELRNEGMGFLVKYGDVSHLLNTRKVVQSNADEVEVDASQ